jgi:hypothetical protein
MSFIFIELREKAAEKGLATDEHGCTRIKDKGLIRVHPCESVTQLGFFRILLKMRFIRQDAESTDW